MAKVDMKDVKLIISRYSHSPLMDMELEWLESQDEEEEEEELGYWIHTEDGDWECSRCGCVVVICVCGKDRTYRKPFCPDCGIKMKHLED